MWKSRIGYLLCICAGIYYAVLYDKYASLAVLWCILLVPVCSVFCLFFWKKMVNVQISNTEQIVKMGEELLVKVIVKNPTIFPVSYGMMKVQYKNQLDKEYQHTDMIYRIDTKSEEQIQLEFHCNHCGLIEIECDYLRIYDYFRLFSVKLPVNCKKEFVVIPEFEVMDDMLEHILDDGTDSNKTTVETGDDSSEIVGIREYHPGDHPKRIHWKLSSKKRQILIKEFAMEEEEMDVVNFGLMLEDGECSYEWYDEKMEELVNTCWTLLQAGRIHHVVWYHPRMGSYETAKIQGVEDIGMLAGQVIRAGVGRLDKEDVL